MVYHHINYLLIVTLLHSSHTGVDENLAHHIAHLFIRDPLVVFEGMIELDDSVYVEHFENIQSTNWQTCRWKPPPPRTKPEVLLLHCTALHCTSLVHCCSTYIYIFIY